MPKRMLVPVNVEARLFAHDTAQIIYHYARLIEKDIVIGKVPDPLPGPDIHGAQCINEFHEGEARVRCTNGVQLGLVHGWLCVDCAYEQHKAVRNREREAKYGDQS